MFENEYRETFSRVTASQETVMEVLNLKKQNERRIYKAPRLALVIAMVLLLTACAVGFNAWDMLDAAFGENGKTEAIYQEIEYIPDNSNMVFTDMYGNPLPEDEQESLRKVFGKSKIISPAMERLPVDEELAEELVTPYITVINQSATNTDVSILSVEAGLYDPATYTGVLYLSLENPSGLPEYEVMNNGRILWNSEDYNFNYLYFPDGESRVGYYYLDETRSNETKLYMTYHFVCRDELDTMTIQFWDSEIGVTFPVPSAELKTITLKDGTFVLSPIGLYDRAGYTWCDKEMSINFLDGTELVLYKTGIWKVNGNFKHAAMASYYVYARVHTDTADKAFGLSRIIDLDNVKSIVIDGTEYFPD